MGLEVLFWIWVLTWMTKTAATDVLHAVKGTTNPRYELKKQKAIAAGKAAPQQPRYGGREWFADLLSDGLAAQTERRRAKAKGQPVDDMVELTREDRPARTRDEWMRPAPDEEMAAALPIKRCPRCGQGEIVERLSNGDEKCNRCMWPQPPAFRHETPEPRVPTQPAPQPEPDTRPIAPVIPMFPNPKHVEKEIIMASSEVTGLSTAMAFADAAASGHNTFATSGAEGYVGALEAGGMGGAAVGSAREAMEASGVAAARWSAHKAELEKQLRIREAYQDNPDAADKQFVVNE